MRRGEPLPGGVGTVVVLTTVLAIALIGASEQLGR